MYGWVEILGLVWLDKFPFVRLTTLGRHHHEVNWVCLTIFVFYFALIMDILNEYVSFCNPSGPGTINAVI